MTTVNGYHWSKWVCALLSLLLVICGGISILIQESYLLTLEQSGDIVVSGFHAVIVGLGYLGSGLCFFGWGVAPYSRFYRWELVFQRVGVLFVAVGVLGGWALYFINGLN